MTRIRSKPSTSGMRMSDTTSAMAGSSSRWASASRAEYARSTRHPNVSSMSAVMSTTSRSSSATRIVYGAGWSVLIGRCDRVSEVPHGLAGDDRRWRSPMPCARGPREFDADDSVPDLNACPIRGPVRAPGALDPRAASHYHTPTRHRLSARAARRAPTARPGPAPRRNAMDPRNAVAAHARRRRPASCAALAAALAATLTPLAAAQSLQLATAQSLQQLGSLSIEELAAIEITSVSKRAEPLASAASAVYVISADDIRRSGVTSLPEALRLAPNLEVARVDSQDYAISARGMNSVNASNKLLVLIDGRSVYTPFFSSVFWDQQQVTLADIERIEVISGPGGTLWGANAVNGVVNIVTKPASATTGGLVDARLGDFTQRADARYGGRLGGVGDYRVYALADREGDTRLADGASADDAWKARQAGFRADLAALAGSVTLQGDVYENLVDTPGGRRSGGNVLGRWTRRLDNGGDVEVQAYYDQQSRSDVAATGGGSSDRVRTLDVEAQHAFAIGATHRIVWGLAYRTWDDEFTNTANPFVLVPQAQTLDLASVFAQDTIALPHRVDLTLGAKYEYNSFSGSALMPSARVGWQADDDNFLWAAISRAVRPPSRLERDLTAPGIVDTSPGFGAEKLVAYEAGYRTQLAPTATLSVSLYYNDYDDLRTTSPAPVTVLPVSFGNGLEGHTY